GAGRAAGRLPGGAGSVRVVLHVPLPARVPTLRPQVFDLAGALAHGDDRQQTPEVVPGREVELAGVEAREEALVDRLEHVLGIDLLSDPGLQPAAGQGEQAGREALVDCRRGRLVADPEAALQDGEGVLRAPDSCI